MWVACSGHSGDVYTLQTCTHVHTLPWQNTATAPTQQSSRAYVLASRAYALKISIQFRARWDSRAFGLGHWAYALVP